MRLSVALLITLGKSYSIPCGKYIAEGGSIRMETLVIPTKWVLKHWMLIFTESVTDFERSKMLEHIANLKKNNAGGVICFASCPCWMHGQIYNRVDFKNNTGVITSRINRIECIDNTLYAITESESRYRLEIPKRKIGIRKENSNDIIVQ